MLAPGDGLVEEVVALPGRALRILRPPDPEALLDEAAFEREEFLPYWAELWPSAVALARAVVVRSLRGARTLELGCGLGLPAIAAALAGARVLATDWSPHAVAAAARNAAENGARLETALCSWFEPEALVRRGPWDLVLAADVLYERRNGEQLARLLPQLVRPGGQVWLADPGRAFTADFLTALAPSWERRSTRDADRPTVVVHRLRPRERGR